MEYTSFLSVYSAIHLSSVGTRVVLKKKINGRILDEAVQESMHRYPYFRRKLKRMGESIQVVPNDKPVAVYEKEESPRKLCSKETNEHLCLIEYRDNEIYFFISHMLAGGCGIGPWVRTIIYQYITKAEKVTLNAEGVWSAKSLPKKDERKFPKLEELPRVTPLHQYNPADSFFPIMDYELTAKCPERYEKRCTCIKVKSDEFMEFCRSHDGSPSALTAVFLLRSLRKVWTYKEAGVLSVCVAHNSRKDVGCPESTCDILRSVHIKYTKEMEGFDTKKLCTCARGMIIAQTTCENSIADARADLITLEEIENQETLEEKVDYALKHPSSVLKIADTGAVSYTGQSDWGELGQYIEELNPVTGGHLVVEIVYMDGSFYLSFQEVLKDTLYLENFLKEFDDEGISYKVTGSFILQFPEVCKDFLNE